MSFTDDLIAMIEDRWPRTRILLLGPGIREFGTPGRAVMIVMLYGPKVTATIGNQTATIGNQGFTNDLSDPTWIERFDDLYHRAVILRDGAK